MGMDLRGGGVGRRKNIYILFEYLPTEIFSSFHFISLI